PAFAAKFAGRPYDGEVATADFGVAMLLDAVPAARRGETVVVVTGDHGESLGEHGESEHGILLYDSTLHVPLVVQGSGIASGVRVSRQVRHVDLMPTIAALAGVSAPAGIDGVSLLPLLRGQTGVRLVSDTSLTPVAAQAGPDAPPSYAESRFGELHFGWNPIHSLRDGAWKFIDGPDPELYQLAADPGERDSRRAARADTASGMGRALDTLVSRATTPQTGAAAGADVAERLRSLGYVSGRVEIGAGRPGGAGRTGGAGNEAAQGDPKREIARYEAYV